MSPITATPKTGRGKLWAGVRSGRCAACSLKNWARWCRCAPRIDLSRAWSGVSWRIARLRCDPSCADEEDGALLDARDRGLTVHLSFNPEEDIAAPFVASGARPRIAILREQGVN